MDLREHALMMGKLAR